MDSIYNLQEPARVRLLGSLLFSMLREMFLILLLQPQNLSSRLNEEPGKI